MLQNPIVSVRHFLGGRRECSSSRCNCNKFVKELCAA